MIHTIQISKFAMPGHNFQQVRELLTGFMRDYRKVCGMRLRWDANGTIRIRGTTDSLGGHPARQDRNTILVKTTEPRWIQLREGLPFAALVMGHEICHWLDWKYDIFGRGDEHDRCESIMSYATEAPCKWGFDWFSKTDIADMRRKLGDPSVTIWPQPVKYYATKIKSARDAGRTPDQRDIAAWRRAVDHYRGVPFLRQARNG